MVYKVYFNYVYTIFYHDVWWYINTNRISQGGKFMQRVLTSLPQETYEHIKKIAEEYSVSKSSVIRMFCVEYLRMEIISTNDFGLLWKNKDETKK